MSSINYLDNSFLWGKKPKQNFVQEIQPRQVVFFHEFHQARKSKFLGVDKRILSYLFGQWVKAIKLNFFTGSSVVHFSAKRSTYFPVKTFALPALLSAIGVVLISISLLSPATLFFAPSTNAASTVNYPPKLVETQATTVASKVETVAEIKASNLVPETNVSLSSASITLPQGLSAAIQWPTRGYITTYFSSSHLGIDIAANYGTAVRPFMEGVVTSVNHFGSGFGNHIIIKHNGFESLYAHLNTTNVAVGQVVKASSLIGTVGATGWATGPHLHLEVSRSGFKINPLSVLP